MPTRPISPRGGPDPVRQEVVLGGPFKGFDGDSANWYKSQGGVLQDAENVDFLKGQIRTRSGFTIGTTAGEFLALPLSNSNAEHRYPDPMSPRGVRTIPGEYVLGWSRFNYYRHTAVSVLQQFPAGGPVLLAAATQRYAVAYMPGFTDYTAANTATGTGDIYFSRQWLVGSYMHQTGGADQDGGGNKLWHLITSQTGGGTFGTASFSTAAAFPSFGVNTVFILPLQWNDNSGLTPGESGIAHIPSTTQYVFPCGETGPVLLDISATPPAQQLQRALDPIKYLCRVGVYYNNRVVLASHRSMSVVAGVWTTTDHPGRIAYSMSGFPQNFSGIGGGIFDLEIGDVFDLFVMRDICYAVGLEGIAAIQKTGNSNMPFRAQTIVQGPRFSYGRAAVVDGAYAILRTPGGPVKFDGGSVSSMSEGLDELFRASATTHNAGSITWKSQALYEPARSRVFIPYHPATGLTTFSTPAKLAVIDTKTQGVTRVAPAGAATWSYIYTMQYYQTEQNGEQDVELVLMCDTGLVYMQRGAVTDGGVNIAWSATSPVLDTQTSRDMKSCDRIRITYEDWYSGTNNITVSLYVDGGVTAIRTATVSLVGTNSRATKTANATFAPVIGQQWCVKISGSSSAKVVINQVALSFVARQEAKPD